MKLTSRVVAGFVGCLITLLMFVPAPAANIAWVSFHPADNMPSANAAAAGFTTAPDKGYTDLLTANGHTVTRFVSKNLPTPADLVFLDSSDLVIIGRSVNSGNYGDPALEAPAERLFWNTSLTSPLINMSGYTLRSSRLGYTTGTTVPDTGPTAAAGGPVRLTVNNPAHPIFAGIALDAMNTMVNLYADAVALPVGAMTIQRGISVNTNPVAGGGTILATVGTPGDLAFGGMIIGKWSPGQTSNFGEVMGGHRMVFLSGTREQGVTGDAAGLFDLAPDGGRLFLNAVNFMVNIPEPSSAASFILATAILGLRRRR